jgi:PAS domain S-box-containing protein
VSLAPVVEDGRQVGLVGVCVDVTERKRAQAERDAQRHLLEQAEGLAGMGSWDMDLRTGKTRWSDGLYRILGYEPGAVAPGREAFVSRLRPQDAEAMRQAFARPGIEGPVALEIEVVRPDGEVRVVRLRGSVEYDEQELPARTVGIMKDVTEQLEIERMKHEFISTVSHELRTPLTAIRGPLSLLRRGWRTLPPEHTQEMLEMAVEGVDRMVRLVNDVLDVQRLATGRLSITAEPADARELAQGAARDLAPRAAAADVRLRVRAPSTPLRADPARVNQVLCNLLDNALSFAPRGSTVDLEVRRLGPWVRFRVADRGPGIPADKLEVVFERFKQLDQSTKRRKGGTGLGLAISRELVGLMGGRIWAEHRRGGGTTFAFELPG